MSKKPGTNEDLLRSVKLIWYPVTLVPIAALVWLGITGIIPQFLAILAIFCFFFWIFSLLFALYALWSQRGTTRA